MQNEMRDRLIELVKKVPYGVSVGATFERHFCEKVADHLIANGVILPPCKVGDTVYFVPQNEILEATVTNIEVNYYTNPQMWLTIEYCLYHINHYKSRIDLMLGKGVFLTKEEAEAKLKEKNNEK